MEINKGMYSLSQAEKLANILIKEGLSTHGYFETKYTSGLWKHTPKLVQFTFVVDNFGVKFVGEENLTHLIKSLQHYYETDIYRTCSQYCGIKLD